MTNLERLVEFLQDKFPDIEVQKSEDNNFFRIKYYITNNKKSKDDINIILLTKNNDKTYTIGVLDRNDRNGIVIKETRDINIISRLMHFLLL